MHLPQIQVTAKSRNSKTGDILVTTTAEETCPAACPLKKAGCYADGGPLAILWRKVSERKAGLAWTAAMAAIANQPAGALWRHNQAGDLPGIGDAIDTAAMADLVAANRGKRGFTFTHKPLDVAGNADAIASANAAGFTVNLSANTLAHADQLADAAIGPVVVVLPADATRATVTPAGRKVALCPATIADDVSCKTCGLCSRADRKAIIGFPAHGASKRKAGAIAAG